MSLEGRMKNGVVIIIVIVVAIVRCFSTMTEALNKSWWKVGGLLVSYIFNYPR